MAAESFSATISIACGVVGMFVGVAGYKYNMKKQDASEGENKGIILTTLGYIQSGIDDIKRKQDNYETRHNELCERVTRNEVKCDQALGRLQVLETKNKQES